MATGLPSDLAAALRRPDWPRAVLIVGTDQALRRSAVDEIVAAIPENERSMAIERVAGVPLARALDAARTPSLMGGRRVVIVRDPEGLAGEGGAEARALLVAYLDALPPDSADLQTLLVLVAAKADLRLAPIKRIAEHGLIVNCDPPRDREMAQWITVRAHAAGLALSAAAAQALADAVGTDTGVAGAEIAKLRLLAAAPAVSATKPAKPVKVDVELVAQSLGPARAVAAFALEDALLAGDARAAWTALDRQLGERDPGLALALLGRLAAICRRLGVAARVLEAGGGEAEVREALGVHPFVAGKYTRAAPQAGRRVGAALAACVIADRRLKSGGDPRDALAPIVMALAARARVRAPA